MNRTRSSGHTRRSFRQHLGLGALAKPHGIEQHPTIRNAHGNHVPAERDLQPQRDRHRVCAGREPDVRKAFAQWQMVRGGWVIAHAADGRSPAMSKQRGVDDGLARREGSVQPPRSPSSVCSVPPCHDRLCPRAVSPRPSFRGKHRGVAMSPGMDATAAGRVSPPCVPVASSGSSGTACWRSRSTTRFWCSGSSSRSPF